MGINFKKVGSLLGKVLPKLVGGISMVESLSGRVDALSGLKGKQKQDAVIAIVEDALSSGQVLVGKDLAKDAEIIAAAREVIDVIVAFNNLVAKKANELD